MESEKKIVVIDVVKYFLVMHAKMVAEREKAKKPKRIYHGFKKP